MNKQTIYVVIAYGGEYDDAWEKNVCARFSETDAQITILDLEERREKLKGMRDPVQAVWYANLKPIEGIESVPQPPKGPKKGTKENMAAHRLAVEEWRKIANPMIERNEQRANAAYLNASKLAREKAIELGADEVDLSQLGFCDNGEFRPPYDSCLDCSYRYEELELQ
jgi:hypothetical protein